jgi:hypothetical protein
MVTIAATQTQRGIRIKFKQHKIVPGTPNRIWARTGIARREAGISKEWPLQAVWCEEETALARSMSEAFEAVLAAPERIEDH